MIRKERDVQHVDAAVQLVEGLGEATHAIAHRQGVGKGVAHRLRQPVGLRGAGQEVGRRGGIAAGDVRHGATLARERFGPPNLAQPGGGCGRLLGNLP